jgi:hypothetical protein
MSELRYTRRDEQIDIVPGRAADVDPSPLLGTWENTNPQTTGIAGVAITRDDTGVVVTVRPADVARAPYRARVDALYGSTVTATAASALTAEFADPSVETRLEANLSLGLLVIGACHTIRNGRGSSYFQREFFYFAGETGAN